MESQQYSNNIVIYLKKGVFITLFSIGAIFGAFKLKNLISHKLMMQQKAAANNHLKNISKTEIQKILKYYQDQFESSKIMEKIIPRSLQPYNNLKPFNISLQFNNQCDTDAIQKAICNPLWDIIDRGGKRIRPIICGLIAEAYGKPFSEVVEIAGFIEVLHNSSLIIDDIEDDSVMRREKETVHIIYGTDISINAGNFAYFAPMHFLMQQNKYSDKQKYELSKIYIEEMTQIHFGQAWDILWHKPQKEINQLPNENQYLQMVINKTGVLLRMMMKMISVILELDSKQQIKLSKFAEKVGAAFQIQDDYLNLAAPLNYTKGKGFRGEDIYEGKVTLIIIHFLQHAKQSDKDQLISMLNMKTKDQQIIGQTIDLLQQYNSLEYSKNCAERLLNEAWEEIDEILPEGNSKNYLNCICKYVINRTNQFIYLSYT